MATATHCKHGHEFTFENTIYRKRKSGGRQCRECKRVDALERKQRKESEYGPAVKRSLDRKQNLKFFYNLSPSGHVEILANQEWKCANPACVSSDTPDAHLHVDHDHTCCDGRRSCGECIRGLLCNTCNRVLGFVDDDITRLEGLVEYLKSWKMFLETSGSVGTQTTKR
jgi:hypothetical protein